MSACLENLPVELLINIFEYLNTTHLLRNVRLTCKHFHSILDETFFRNRIKSRFKDKAVPQIAHYFGLRSNCEWKPGSKFSWKSMCFHFLAHAQLWDELTNFEANHGPEINRPSMNVTDAKRHTECVDTVKIFNKGRLAVSGGRDRALFLWSVANAPDVIECVKGYHEGWIWDIESVSDDSCFTCDWNGEAILWSVSRGLQPIKNFSVHKPMICVTATPEYYVVGLQSKEICFLDPRINMSNPLFLKVHRAAVMDIAIQGPYIVTVSEDKYLTITDVRKLSKVKSYKISKKSPISISKVNNLFFVADTCGGINIVDSDIDFEIAMTLQNHRGRLTSICAQPGILYTGSRDHYLTVSTISDPLLLRADINLGAEIACVDYSHDVLAVARSDSVITFFSPKHFHQQD